MGKTERHRILVPIEDFLSIEEILDTKGRYAGVPPCARLLANLGRFTQANLILDYTDKDMEISVTKITRKDFLETEFTKTKDTDMLSLVEILDGCHLDP